MSYRVHTHSFWSKYIRDGRLKYERTLYDPGFRIRFKDKYNPSGDIEMYPAWMPSYSFITIHPDDTMTIKNEPTVTLWGYTIPKPVQLHSIKYRVWKYSGIHLKVRNGKLLLTEYDAGKTPSKIQGCRTCSSTGHRKEYCYTQTCYEATYDESTNTSRCAKHNISNAGKHRWHRTSCAHGRQDGHYYLNNNLSCWSCNGTKRRDYGNKLISIPWDGYPLRVKGGNIFVQQSDSAKLLESMVNAYV